jgi:hypothetical protein
MSSEYLFIFSFCVYRISFLLSEEDGPFGLVIKFRKLLGKSWLGKLMDCFYCTSIWISFLLVFIFVKGELMTLVMESFATSGAAIAIHKLTSKSETTK